jgi:hypothetical protein
MTLKLSKVVPFYVTIHQILHFLTIKPLNFQKTQFNTVLTRLYAIGLCIHLFITIFTFHKK